MSKRTIENKLAERMNISISQSKLALKCVLDILAEEVSKNKRVRLWGFGTFESKKCMKEYSKNGLQEKQKRKSHVLVKFYPGLKLVRLLNYNLDKSKSELSD